MADLRQLRALQAVAEGGSFSAAADALNYTQPAISKTIAGLEAELGAVLVERQQRPLQLTDAGQALIRHADEVFARLSSAQAEIDAITRVDAGSVGVGTFSSAGATFVVDALCAFRREHPNVEVTIAEGIPSAMIKRLRAGELDLAVIWDLPDAGDDMGVGLEVHHLFDDPWALVLNPDHPLAGQDVVDPRDLADEDWLMPSFMPGGPSARTLGRWAASHGFEPNIVFRVNDCQMTKAMVAANEGVSLIPRMMLDPPPAEVVIKRMSGQPIARRISAVRLPTRYLSPACAAFLEATRDAASRREALQQA